MGKCIDLTGQKFGKLTVIKKAGRTGANTTWICECECKNIVTVRGDYLKTGHTQSCGCLKTEHPNRTTHGKNSTRIYGIWCKMKGRCYNQNNPAYPNYGGRGITICREWQNDFQAFYDWAINNGYAENLTIDRKDNDKGYSPDNCRWATPKEQANNKRNNKLYCYKGETLDIGQWAKKMNINYSKLYYRLTHNWSIEKALNTP